MSNMISNLPASRNLDPHEHRRLHRRERRRGQFGSALTTAINQVEQFSQRRAAGHAIVEGDRRTSTT